VPNSLGYGEEEVVTTRELDRILLARHDEKMRRPIKELFPSPAPRAVAACKACGKMFERAAHVGKSRGFCGERCRDAFSFVNRNGITRSHQRRLDGPKP